MEELDLKELLLVFWEKKIEIILIIAIFATIGVAYSLIFVTPTYKASTTLLLATNSSSGTEGTSITTTDMTLNSKLVSTYSELVKSSNKIIRTVISNLNLNISEDELKDSISVTSKTNTEVIEITVKNENPTLAAKIANEMAKVFIGDVKEYYGIENVHIVDEAEVPQNPSNINPTKDVAMFIFVGVAISVVYVIIASMLDTKIKSEGDIEKITGCRVLVTLPLYERDSYKRNKRRGR